MSIEIKGALSERNTGRFELWVCRSCEYAEWYVSGAADIDPGELDKKNRKHVRLVDASVEADGPFR